MYASVNVLDEVGMLRVGRNHPRVPESIRVTSANNDIYLFLTQEEAENLAADLLANLRALRKEDGGTDRDQGEGEPRPAGTA